MDNSDTHQVHWSFWAIGAAGLVFNLMGCANYVTQMNAEMVAAMPDVYRAVIEDRPAWGTGAFAIAVFGGALGCILLLLRKSAAVYAFIVSLMGTLVAQIPYIGAADFPVEAWIGWLSQFVIGAFLIWYAIRTKVTGWIS